MSQQIKFLSQVYFYVNKIILFKIQLSIFNTKTPQLKKTTTEPGPIHANGELEAGSKSSLGYIKTWSLKKKVTANFVTKDGHLLEIELWRELLSNSIINFNLLLMTY